MQSTWAGRLEQAGLGTAKRDSRLRKECITMNIALTPVRFLDRAITLFGSKTAVVCQGRRWTYAELGERVNRLANGLVRLGIQPGDRVAFLGYNSHQLLECYYGIPMMGAVLLPLNIRLIAQDFEYICNDSEPEVSLPRP